MKKILAGIAILTTGYGIALLLPPDQIPYLKNVNFSLIKTEAADAVTDAVDKITETDKGKGSAAKGLSDNEDSRALESKLNENPTYLREVDLFQIPGLGETFSLRVGPPLPAETAKDLQEKLPSAAPAYAARFQTATGVAKAIVLYGELENRDQAELLRDSLQPAVAERLEVVYLPACVAEGDTDDAGFYCGEDPPEEVEPAP